MLKQLRVLASHVWPWRIGSTIPLSEVKDGLMDYRRATHRGRAIWYMGETFRPIGRLSVHVIETRNGPTGLELKIYNRKKHTSVLITEEAFLEIFE